MLFSSPAGVALTAPESLATGVGQDAIFTAGQTLAKAAGESYIQLKGGAITTGTSGQFIAYASSHDLIGPKEMPLQVQTMVKAMQLAQPICEDCEKRARQMNEETDQGGGSASGQGSFIDQGLVSGIAGPLSKTNGSASTGQGADAAGIIWL